MGKVHYDLADLRALFELARQQGFNRAANALALTTSALSNRIAKIETAVGGRVVERTTRSVELTPLAKAILLHAAPLLDALDGCMEGASRVASGQIGQLTIGSLLGVAGFLWGRLQVQHQYRAGRA